MLVYERLLRLVRPVPLKDYLKQQSGFVLVLRIGVLAYKHVGCDKNMHNLGPAYVAGLSICLLTRAATIQQLQTTVIRMGT